MKKLQHTHLVNPSPWPITGAMSAMMMTLSTVIMMYKKNNTMMMMATTLSMITFFSWSKDILTESSMEGQHSKKTSSTLKLGMILFIVSEVFLFVSMFWAFFHSSMSPSMEVGMIWPPKNIFPFNYEEIPMTNTIILVSSGGTLTMSHHLLLKKSIKMSATMLMITVNLGITFTAMQLIEYMESKFSINDSVFGASFFMATGLHGAHVIVGSTFLTVVLFQMKNLKSMTYQFLSFEMAAWYWHFVDVVWLFLLISIYWWGS
uniref:Cytochrome c oxidase subunit 3 n=1 Tax=Walchia hayashii TaxID=436352 RepID=B3IUL8_9ACAR|nr:cytochrome c oxidase subunit III [Walchia hayashii]BAG24172.1 cytochrome oxidase subunit 3 [Walchia hayashii]